MPITPLSGGLSMQRAGSNLSVFKKEADGHWRLFRHSRALSPVEFGADGLAADSGWTVTLGNGPKQHIDGPAKGASY
jgi:hypothetical protein